MVQDVRPSTPHGRPAKAVVGELTPVTASIFREGHDVLAARAVLRQGGEVVSTCAMTNTGNDEWSATVKPVHAGAHELVIEAWTDRYATWAHKAAIKLAARDDVKTEVAEAMALLTEASEGGKTPAGTLKGSPDRGNPTVTMQTVTMQTVTMQTVTMQTVTMQTVTVWPEPWWR